MLQSIYASKLYKTSTRKSRIRAAAENPMNVELVAQLAKSLDEEYKTDDYLLTEEDKAAKVAPKASGQGGQPGGEESGGADFGGKGGFSGGPSGGGHFSGGGPDFGGDDFGGEGGPEGDIEEGGDAPADIDAPADNDSESSKPAKEASDTDVKESTKIRGKKVTASSDFKDMNEVANQIKGLLNFKDSTSGVNRTLIKENEFWIYYNDDINLNNIMAIVIDTLNGSGYTYLEFNRLARSDNAIVFEIAFRSSDNQVKPKEGVETEEPEVDVENIIKE